MILRLRSATEARIPPSITSLELVETDFDLIERERIGRHEVECHMGMRSDKLPHGRRFVDTQITQDGVDGSVLRTVGNHFPEARARTQFGQALRRSAGLVRQTVR